MTAIAAGGHVPLGFEDQVGTSRGGGSRRPSGPRDPEAGRVSGTLVDGYLRLGHQLDRHVEGIGACFGPPELAAEVRAAPPVDPWMLAADAESLLSEIEDGWLHDQVAGLHTLGREVTGDTLAYRDEVALLGVRPHRTDEAAFADAHARLDEVLPGTGQLAERYQSCSLEGTFVPRGAARADRRDVIDRARDGRTRWWSFPPARALRSRSSPTSPGAASVPTSAIRSRSS